MATTFEQIKKILDETATNTKCCSTQLLINACKEQDIKEEDVMSAIDKFQKDAYTYILPETICIIDEEEVKAKIKRMS